MDIFIYENLYSIPSKLCNDIIKTYNENEINYLNNGIEYDNNYLSQYKIEKNDEKWEKTHNFLLRELNKNIAKYINIINKNYQNLKYPFSLLRKEFLINENNIICYKKSIKNKNKTFYNFNNQLSNKDIEITTKLSFVWFLENQNGYLVFNFNKNLKIKIEKGKLVIFPSSWFFSNFEDINDNNINNYNYIIFGNIY